MTRRRLLRLVEIAELLGVSKQRADQLWRQSDFAARLVAELGLTFGPPQTFGAGLGPTGRRGAVGSFSQLDRSFMATWYGVLSSSLRGGGGITLMLGSREGTHECARAFPSRACCQFSRSGGPATPRWGRAEFTCGGLPATIIGTDGPDEITVGGPNQVVVARGGNDLVFAGSVWDTVVCGGEGDDVLFGHSGNDTLYGDEGNDGVFDSFGNGRLYGGDGNDEVSGSHGDDVVWGGDGDDRLRGNFGEDVTYGGAGNDDIHTSLTFGAQALAFGGDGNDLIIGGHADDVIYGNDGDDRLFGFMGSDQLFGGDGADQCFDAEVIVC